MNSESKVNVLKESIRSMEPRSLSVLNLSTKMPMEEATEI